MVRTRDEDCRVAGRLQIGDTIELTGSTGRPGACQTRVIDIETELITIEPLPYGDDHTPLRPGCRLRATFTRDDAVYSFTTRVINIANGHGGSFSIAPPERIERIQRRGFFRIPAECSASITPLKRLADMETGVSTHPEAVAGRCLDLSAGGLALIVSDLGLQPGDYLLVRLEIGRAKAAFACPGEVVRFEVSDPSQCKYGIRFFTSDEARSLMPPELFTKLPQQHCRFSERDREALVNQLLVCQLELRQRGML
jgi:c-di-GMP-binding flagellar brake protein YcgR